MSISARGKAFCASLKTPIKEDRRRSETKAYGMRIGFTGSLDGMTEQQKQTLKVTSPGIGPADIGISWRPAPIWLLVIQLGMAVFVLAVIVLTYWRKRRKPN